MRIRLISAAALSLACLLPHAHADSAPRPLASSITSQLPRVARPVHYALTLTPDASSSTFAARSVITLDVLTPTASITLHAADLAFQRARMSSARRRGATSPAVSLDTAAQTATFSFPRPLPRGRYRLALDYTGLIGRQATGLFSLDYDSPAGKARALYTQFENSDARRMIPSWDEPAYKATFALEAIVPAAQMAVSNMPIVATRALPDGRKRVTFGQTPTMSTYLLFFGLGDFDRATATVDGTEVGVVTRKGIGAQAAFALEASVAVMREYTDYFGVRYPLPKLDNIAAPGSSQFFAAMENWGAIMSFEYALLLDPAFSTQADKQEVFATAAHEIAHQWFGNLVTMQWWDDLWLNEGFASWMESRMSTRLHPEWNTALNTVNVREQAMARDAVATTHPVVQHVETVEQASQAFDSITYQKGAAVIHMLERYVGEDAWRNGVRAYIKAHAYGNTASDDLWRQIERAANKPITAIAHDFTLQPGVPMIRVDSATCSGGATIVNLAQAEFSRDQPEKKPLRWRVPVIAQIAGAEGQAHTLVNDGTASMRVPGCGAVIVNAGQSGYYRTLYAPPVFAALAGEFGKLAPIDQLGVLSDSWSLGLAGLQSPSDFLDLAKGTPLTADPQVWGKIAGVFSAIHGYSGTDGVRKQRFAAFAIGRLAPLLARIGWNARSGELETFATLRTQLIGTLAGLGDAATIAEARRRYAAQGSDPEAVPGPLRQTISQLVAAHADAATWDGMRAAARAEKSPMIKNQMYSLLASASDPALAQRALDLALTDEPGETNTADMLAQVAGKHPELAFDFALANMDKVNARVDASSRSVFFPRLAGNSYDPAMIARLNAYAQAHVAPAARRATETAVAGIALRAKVRKERMPAIDTWLARQ